MKKAYIKRYQSNFKIRYLSKLAEAFQRYRQLMLYRGTMPTIEEQKGLTGIQTDNNDVLWGLNYDFNYMKADIDKMVMYMGKNHETH